MLGRVWPLLLPPAPRGLLGAPGIALETYTHSFPFWSQLGSLCPSDVRGDTLEGTGDIPKVEQVLSVRLSVRQLGGDG